MSNHYYLYIHIYFFFSRVEGPPLKRRKTVPTQLPEIFEANHEDPPYFDVDMGIGIDFGGDDFFLHTRLQGQWSNLNLGNDPDMGRMDMDEVISLRHSSEVELWTMAAICINVVWY